MHNVVSQVINNYSSDLGETSIFIPQIDSDGRGCIGALIFFGYLIPKDLNWTLTSWNAEFHMTADKFEELKKLAEEKQICLTH